MEFAALLLAAVLWGAPAGAGADEPAAPAFEGGREMNVTATAYTSGPESTGKRRGHPQYGITFSGTRATEGQTIAVDPKVIPLGSEVFVYELRRTFIAEDTGGAIKGARIDLYMDQVQDAVKWGVRQVRVQVRRKI